MPCLRHSGASLTLASRRRDSGTLASRMLARGSLVAGARSPVGLHLIMPALSLTPAQIDQIVSNVAAFIEDQRRVYAPSAQPLGEADRARLAIHFPAEVLDSARFVRVRSLKNPAFYPELARMGFTNLPQFRAMAAITFVDVVAAQEQFTPSLLFHELVHVVQYRQLGLARFAELYVRGFLETGEYLSIPLERVAYHLEDMFRLRPDLRIEVEAHISLRLENGHSASVTRNGS